MTFAFSEYLMTNLMLPVFALAFIAVPTVKMLGRILRKIANGERDFFGDMRGLLIFVVMIVVAVILILSLFRGGIHLAYEWPKDAVQTQGTIEQIDALNAFEGARYSANGEVSNGYTYTIDGTTCTGMAKGTLEVGDEVIVTYLPKSGFVLSIEEVNP